MEIRVKRIARKDSYTIGRLYIDDEYFCDTLEDKDRGLKQTDTLEQIKKVKVKDETAIPIGTYKVTLSYSPRFKKILPLIENVKGFDGIRIHSGNTNKDTSGCLLVGKNTKVGMVTSSRDTMKDLMFKLLEVKDISIVIN